MKRTDKQTLESVELNTWAFAVLFYSVTALAIGAVWHQLENIETVWRLVAPYLT